MYKLFLFLSLLGIVLFGACQGNPFAPEASVGIVSRVKNSTSQAPAFFKAPTSGQTVTTIDEYKATFKKIELSWDGEEWEVLWENSDGEEKNVVDDVVFDNVKKVKTGKYRGVRITLGTVLNIKGTIKEDDTVYKGTGKREIQEEQIWSTVAGSLTEEIEIADGKNLAIVFDVSDTVKYTGEKDDAGENILSVEKPNMTILVE